MACDKKGLIKCWDIASKSMFFEYQAKEAQEAKVYCLEISHDTRYIITTSGESSIKVCDIKNKNHTELFGHKTRVDCMVQTHNKKLITGGRDGNINIWDLESLKFIYGFAEIHKTGIYGSIMYLALSSDDSLLASGGYDGSIKILNHQNRQIIKQIKAHVEAINFLIFTVNNQFLVSGSQDKFVCAWSLSNDHCIRFEGHEKSVVSIMISNNNEYIASVGKDFRIFIWNFNIRRKQGKIKSIKDLACWEKYFPDIFCYSKFLKS